MTPGQIPAGAQSAIHFCSRRVWPEGSVHPESFPEEGVLRLTSIRETEVGQVWGTRYVHRGWGKCRGWGGEGTRALVPGREVDRAAVGPPALPAGGHSLGSTGLLWSLDRGRVGVGVLSRAQEKGRAAGGSWKIHGLPPGKQGQGGLGWRSGLDRHWPSGALPQ